MANGQVITSARGSVVKVLSVALVGLALTGSLGTVVALGNQNAALTGQAITSAQGTVVQSATRALTGRQINASQGLVYGTGRSLVQSSQGTAVANNTHPLVGLASTTGTGLITPNAAGTVPLVGSAITSATGTLLAPGSMPLTGVASTAAVGTLAPTLRPTDPVGQAIISAQGSVSILANDVTVNITGYEIISQQGIVDSTPILASQVITSAAGTILPTTQIPLVGSASTLGQGTLQVDQGASEDTFIQSASGTSLVSATVPLVGLVSTGATGTLGLTSDVNQALTGASSTSATGLLVPTPLVALDGEQLQSAQESMGAPGYGALSGQAIQSQQGTVFITEDRVQALTGASSSCLNGSVVAGPRIVLGGSVLTGGTGQLGRSGGNMALALTGQSATANTGIVGVIGGVIPTIGVSTEGCSIISETAQEGCGIISGIARETAQSRSRLYSVDDQGTLFILYGAFEDESFYLQSSNGQWFIVIASASSGLQTVEEVDLPGDGIGLVLVSPNLTRFTMVMTDSGLLHVETI